MTMGAPRYCWSEGDLAPPGHRFRLYLDVWNEGFQLQRRGERLRLLKEGAGFRVLAALHELNPRDRKLLQDLRERQARLATKAGAWSVEARAVAPFTTGLGNEHPLENGFAFLDPYGLPYLPGSGVKGVVRRAAEELALFEPDPQGWSIPAVWWLFGFDPGSGFFTPPGGEPEVVREERRRWRQAFQERIAGTADGDATLLRAFLVRAVGREGLDTSRAEDGLFSWLAADQENPVARRELAETHTRGALEFWDVIPEPAEGKLRVDIMNPHFGHYYQKSQAPGEWGNPVPIYFLTLPPETAFTFVVRFRPPGQWPEEVKQFFGDTEQGLPRWQRLLAAAFAFAFEWLGFGAKTAVGYGRMWGRHREERPGPASAMGNEEGSSASLPKTPAAEMALPPELEAVRQKLDQDPPPRFSKEEIDSIVNVLARHYRHPFAERLANRLAEVVADRPYLRERILRHGVVGGLVRR